MKVKEVEKMKELLKLLKVFCFETEKLEIEGWVTGLLRGDIELEDIELLEGVTEYKTGEVKTIKLEEGIRLVEGKELERGYIPTLKVVKELEGEEYVLGYKNKEVYIFSKEDMKELIEGAFKKVSEEIKELEAIKLDKLPTDNIYDYITKVVGLEIVTKGSKEGYVYKDYLVEKEKYMLEMRERPVFQEISQAYKEDENRIGYESIKYLVLRKWVWYTLSVEDIYDYVDILGGLLYYSQLLNQLQTKLEIARELLED